MIERRSGLVAILGPTASGKSAVAYELALAVGGEIISCDSMQVYRGMAIGTAQPGTIEMANIPHHLVGEIEIDVEWNAYRHKVLALQRIKEVQARGRLPILVGGTGMYAKAILYDLPMYPSEKRVYAAAYSQALDESLRPGLLTELQKSTKDGSVPDDVIANPRRLARAIEILRLTGEVPEGLGEMPNNAKTRPVFDARQFVMLPPARELRQKIQARTDWMLRNGWIEETEALLKCGLRNAPTARQALGYPRVIDYIDGKIAGITELQKIIAAETWKYARKQRTWFRHQHPGSFLLTLRLGVDNKSLLIAIKNAVL
jgi:tRNA dimethylallyltransferase